MNKGLIVIDGKTYQSVDEMPEDVRRNYESGMSQVDQNGDGAPDILASLRNAFADKNKDGVPDAFEGMMTSSSNVMATSSKFIVNGSEYNSLDDLPPEMRAKYEQAMGAVDANRNGIPDFLEGMLNMPQQNANAAKAFQAEQPARSSQPMPVNATIEPQGTSGWMLALGIILLLGLCLVGAAGVWYFYIR